MRILVGVGIFKEIDINEYTHTSLSRAFCLEVLVGEGVLFDLFPTSRNHCPTSRRNFKTHGPEELFDLRKNPFAFNAGHEDKTYFEALDLDPKQRTLWDFTLQNIKKNFPILGMFPIENLEESRPCWRNREELGDLWSILNKNSVVKNVARQTLRLCDQA
ncbi:hypothetical protein N7532_009173 [Penicillium argentinense]|uniref:Uncharacterized protein n=1 Tax=Penicillium argentinense TaxID=1131581 RepID=A0A9W9EYY9_9EURO|nr:uncharacterized protein N7532_009173 [Penicillium argentinense]KAJ5090489.1 hypothetical protein N7532_009173 [Penicillium argentinense]